MCVHNSHHTGDSYHAVNGVRTEVVDGGDHVVLIIPVDGGHQTTIEQCHREVSRARS